MPYEKPANTDSIGAHIQAILDQSEIEASLFTDPEEQKRIRTNTEELLANICASDHEGYASSLEQQRLDRESEGLH